MHRMRQSLLGWLLSSIVILLLNSVLEPLAASFTLVVNHRPRLLTGGLTAHILCAPRS